MKIVFRALMTLLIIFSVSTASFAQKNKKSDHSKKSKQEEKMQNLLP